MFHYFPTKSDFYAAVVEAAGQRSARGRSPSGTPARAHSLLDLRIPPVGRPPAMSTSGWCAGPRAEIRRSWGSSTSCVWALVPNWLEAAGLTTADGPLPDATTQLIVRGWLVGFEEIALVWDPQVVREQLVDRLTDAFFAVAGHVPVG